MVVVIRDAGGAELSRKVIGVGGLAPGEERKVDLRNPTDESTAIFDLSATPILFPNGIRVTTLTTAVATIIGRAPGST